MKKVELPSGEGIVSSTAEETIRNVERLARSVSVGDNEILRIMQQTTDNTVPLDCPVANI